LAYAHVPEGLKDQLLSHPWNGFMTNVDSTSNSNTQIRLHFVETEGVVSGTITLFGLKVGNGRHTFSRFLNVSYDDKRDILYLSFWPPGTAWNTMSWVLESTKIEKDAISGIFLEQPLPEEVFYSVEKGTFRVE